jgi:hypothetical protein
MIDKSSEFMGKDFQTTNKNDYGTKKAYYG